MLEPDGSNADAQGEVALSRVLAAGVNKARLAMLVQQFGHSQP